MPYAAPTACSEVGCPHRALERGRCSVHRRSTAERGYDAAHQARRRRALARYSPSDRCPRCGLALGSDPSRLDLGHGPGQVGYNGLEHASCNRAARRPA